MWWLQQWEHPHGGWNNKDLRNYEWNKLGRANTVHLAHNRVHCFDGIWMAYCGKCNIWSGAHNAHTTGFHDAVLLAGASYHLSSTHPYHNHHSSNSNVFGILVKVLNTTASVPGEGVDANNDLIQIWVQGFSSPLYFSDFHSCEDIEQSIQTIMYMDQTFMVHFFSTGVSVKQFILHFEVLQWNSCLASQLHSQLPLWSNTHGITP